MTDFGLINTPSKYLQQFSHQYGDIADYLISEKVDSSQFSNYRYGIDVDGNSNFWGAFFQKCYQDLSSSKFNLIQILDSGIIRELLTVGF